MDDPVSCLLCLDAFERATMLRVVLRPITGGDPQLYCFCQRCGGAIAAEYLYLNPSKKPEATIVRTEDDPPSGETWYEDSAHEHEPGFMQPPIEEAAAGGGEVETVAAPKESAASPRKGKKEGRKDAQ